MSPVESPAGLSKRVSYISAQSLGCAPETTILYLNSYLKKFFNYFLKKEFLKEVASGPSPEIEIRVNQRNKERGYSMEKGQSQVQRTKGSLG